MQPPNKLDLVIGVLGGFGPKATLTLLDKILNITDHKYQVKRDQEHLNMIVDIYSKMPCRIKFIFKESNVDLDSYFEKMTSKMCNNDVDLIVMPCVSAHVCQAAVQQAVDCFNSNHHKSIGFLNLVDLISYQCHQNIVNKQLNKRVGQLSTKGLIESKVLANKIIQYGMEPVLPDQEYQQKILDCILLVKQNKLNEAAVLLEESILYMEQKLDCQQVILGCTELPVVIGMCEKVNKDRIIDSLDLQAEYVVRLGKREIEFSDLVNQFK